MVLPTPVEYTGAHHWGVARSEELHSQHPKAVGVESHQWRWLARVCLPCPWTFRTKVYLQCGEKGDLT